MSYGLVRQMIKHLLSSTAKRSSVQWLVQILFICTFSGATYSAVLWKEGFEGTFPPVGWQENSVEQSTTYTFDDSINSVKLGASGDYLITPKIHAGKTLTFWSYTTAANPNIIVDYATITTGPWTEFFESPFSGYTLQWNGRWTYLTALNDIYIRFRKSGRGTLYIDDISIEESIAVSNQPPVLNPIGDRAVPKGRTLSFNVTASDQVDNDSITLSATNLPFGATFTNHFFHWSNAAPVGICTSTFYAVDKDGFDNEIVTITVTNPPALLPQTDADWNVIYNLPQQSTSSTVYPDQFRIRDALISRIDALQSGDTGTLTTFTFSSDASAGYILHAIHSALERGAILRFIADGNISIGTTYGGTHSLLSLFQRDTNPLQLIIDGSSSGIMHNKLGLFDYGGSNQWVFTASWNFTLAACAYQWNVALEMRSPSLYTIYIAEIDELIAGRFHNNPAKSHAHDGESFALNGSWGTHFVRFAPYPDQTHDDNHAERDIIQQIDQAQNQIIFALNKLTRVPIRDALIAAANRGIRIRGVMPKSDTDPEYASSAIYDYLVDSANYATTNTVQLFTAYTTANYSAPDNGELNLIHTKYMVIDPNSTNAVVIHGSANWTAAALVSNRENDENTVFLRHNEIAKHFNEHFQRVTGTGLFDGGNSILIEWDFDDGDQIADGGITTNQTQTITRFPTPSTYTYSSGALSANGWNNGAGTASWQIDLSTQNHTDIKISSKQTSTQTAPAHFQLQYKIGEADTYTNVTNITVDSGWGGQLIRHKLPTACNNQPHVFLRWLMMDETAVNTNPVRSTGASRIDNIHITGNAYNMPPTLDSINHLIHLEGQTISFNVNAYDPIDHDPITLSATNLPIGAFFENGQFYWETAAPAGTYSITFSATDKDGSDNKTIDMTILPKPALLLSEIADPDGTDGGNDRFVELHNAGTNTINLDKDNWHLSKQVNGSTWYDIPLSGSIEPLASWVIAFNATDFNDAYGFEPNQESGTISGNGDDAYFLYCKGNHTNGILIDLYGQIDTHGENTPWDYENSRATRKNNVLRPSSEWTASEWTIVPGSTTNQMTPGDHGPLPEFLDLNNSFIFFGDDLILPVTAVNTIRTDRITLFATALPVGAEFSGATGTNIVHSTLSWARPAVGNYTATLTATGYLGTTTKTIDLTISSHAQIEGGFHGWSGDTIFKLTNGQFLRQIGWDSKIVPALFYPQITITNIFDTKSMIVENIPGYVTVEKTDIVESVVSNHFTGLSYQNIYQLKDGTTWKQISFENQPSAPNDPITVWRWINDDQTNLRFLNQNHSVIGSCIVEAINPPDNATIYSQIKGYFRGWKHQRIFVLQNGQFWQQTSLHNSSETLYGPDVTIINWLQTERRISINDSTQIQVKQLTNVTYSTIDGLFHGLGYHHLFHLKNGSWWRQTSSEKSASTHSHPNILIWSENKNDLLEIPDEGRTVTVEPLTVHTESSITNPFTGLNHGNIYQFANGETWQQISFDRNHDNIVNPLVMRWTDKIGNNLFIRDDLDRPIGTCRVIKPMEDSDRDGLNNADEILAGFDPLNAQSQFTLSLSDLSILHWDSKSGRVYSIEWTPSLTQKFCSLKTNIHAPQNQWTDTVHSTETKGFYRIRARLAN